MKKILLHAGLTYKIRKAFFNVYNELGYGHKEQIYQKALIKEFTELNLPFKKEVGLNVYYKENVVGKYRPDFVVDDKIIIEIKAVDFMPRAFESQLIHYLKSTRFELGMLVNFGTTKLQIKRLVWTTNNQCKSVSNQRKS